MSSWVFLMSCAEGPADLSAPELLARSGHDVIAVLTDDALPASLIGAQDHLQRAGVRVLRDRAAVSRRGMLQVVQADTLVTHDEIAALMLDPARKVVWR